MYVYSYIICKCMHVYVPSLSMYQCTCSYAHLFMHLYSTVKDYAKWQLLLHALSLYIAPLPQDNWKIFRDTKFPKTTKLSDDTKLSCIELIETVMPLAVARPFVEEFTTGSMKVKV